MNDIRFRLSLILTRDDMDRLQFSESNGEKEIIADVHGMKCYEAKKFVNNIVNLVRVSIKLIVIHGYNHGTAIKKMLNSEYSNPHVCQITTDNSNMGRTYIFVAA